MTEKTGAPEAPEILVIGVGNDFRSDDSVGLQIVRQLRQTLPTQVAVVEIDGDGTDLMQAWKDFKSVFVVDAVQSDGEPGELLFLDVTSDPLSSIPARSSCHLFGVGEAIELARSLNQLPPKLRVYGIEGRSFEFGQSVSPEVEKSATVLLERLRDDIRQELIGF